MNPYDNKCCSVSAGVAANQTCISGAISLLAVFDTRRFSLGCLKCWERGGPERSGVAHYHPHRGF